MLNDLAKKWIIYIWLTPFALIKSYFVLTCNDNSNIDNKRCKALSDSTLTHAHARFLAVKVNYVASWCHNTHPAQYKPVMSTQLINAGGALDSHSVFFFPNTHSCIFH